LEKLCHGSDEIRRSDGDIIFKEGKFHLFFKSEDGDAGIKLAVSDRLTEGYVQAGPERIDQSRYPVEGSEIFKLNNSDEWILMYDLYTKGGYQFTRSSDLRNFTVINQEISMNFHPRHGTVIPITQKELKALVAQWGTFDDLLVKPHSGLLKKQNVYFKTKERKIFLPVKTGTEYSFEIGGKGKEVFQVFASEDHNPVLEGFYADPEILYSEKNGKEMILVH